VDIDQRQYIDPHRFHNSKGCRFVGSLLHIKLIVAIETEFGIRFDVLAIKELENVQQIARLSSGTLNL
jgi:hypothetical protein